MNIRQTVRIPRRVLSLALCAAMVLTLLPLPARAEGICAHHPEHTADCGYKAAVAGQACSHVCGEECYTVATDCKHTHGESCYSDGMLPAEGEEKTADACTHACTEESGCVTKTPACVHTAHEGCGYVAAVAGSPCTNRCEICAQQENQQQNGQGRCTHGNDPAACEACASDARVASVQKLIDALPETVTEENREKAQSALSAVDTAKAALTESEQEKLNLTRYTALKALLAEQDSPNTGKVITDWEWDDGYEIVDEKSGYVILPFTAEAFTANFEEVKGMLPKAILVDGETLTLGNWTYETGEEGTVVTIDSESCPSPGIFKTTLPQGYTLPDGTNVLSLTVALSAGSSEDTSSYADSDTLTNVSYYDADGTRKTCPSATIVTNTPDVEGGNTITWGEPGKTTWYVVNKSYLPIGDFDNKWTIYVKGDVHLIMMQGSWLCMTGRIEVLPGNSLTIYCDNTSNSGKLQAWYTQGGNASIGGSAESPDSGTITINSGSVSASSSGSGAGIGSGEGGSAGDITINGGKIELSSRSGAGLGTGKGGTSATITINNCASISGHSASGALIGSGQEGAAGGNVTVKIRGGAIGTVPGAAAGSAGGAVIGSGKGSQANVTVNITGGNINTYTNGSGDGYHGAAIGGGYNARNTHVTIGGSAIVDGHGGENAPGIGSIDPEGCSVTITGGTVKAWGGAYGAGIGGAHNRNSCPVTITGGTVTANGGATGAGIGSGCGGTSTVRYNTGRIEISGGTVTANGSYFAAGIGGGEYNTAGEILINGGTVVATRDSSKDAETYYPAKDVGDGATNHNQKYVYARYTLNNSAKLYLQNGFSTSEYTARNSGYIFNGTPDTYSEIQVYGTQTLSEAFCIAEGKTMTVTNGASLNASSNLYVEGTLTGTASGNIYYPLTLKDCAASGNTATYGENLFGKAGATISLTPTLQGGYKLDNWMVTPSSVSVSGNSFRMPEQATTVKAKGKLAVEITQQPENKEITYGADVTLSVTAKNLGGTTDGIAYQWYQVIDGKDEKLSGKTENSLTLTKPNAGTYSYFCRVTWDGISIDSNTATVKVNKAAGSVTINNDPGKPYDGQHAFTGYTVTGSGNVIIKYKVKDAADSTYTEIAPTNAGSYTVRVTLPESQNYTGAFDTKDFTITKAKNNAWRNDPEAHNFSYGDTVTTPVTYEAEYGNGNVVVTYKKQGTEDQPSTTVPTDAGTYDVTVSLAETDSYPALAPVNLTLTIAKAASSVTTAPTDAQSLYNGNPVPLVAEGTANGGTMQYSLDGQNWSNDIPKATDWKTYTVYYKVAGDNNHNDTTAQTLTAEIVPFKIDGQPTKVTTSYGDSPWMYVDLKTQLSEQISYQWYQVTGSEGDVELSGETANKLTIDKPNAGTYSYICKITCGDYFKYSDPITVTVNPAQVENVGLSGYWAEGGEREIAPNETVTLTNPSSRLLTKYTTTTNDQGGEYPTGMQVFKLDENNQPVEITELGNLLQYSGCSIRINGKPGIRMITSLTKEAKELLKKGELAGYTLEEYGTVAVWSSDLDNQPLTLNTKKSRSNYAYKRGVSDPVFANVGALTQYTNVLVWDSLEAKKYDEDIVMRPYIKLSNKEGQTVVLYGGTVSRSIGYVAQQNANTFSKGTAGYKYVHEIIDKVNALNSSTGTNTTTGGNG